MIYSKTNNHTAKNEKKPNKKLVRLFNPIKMMIFNSIDTPVYHRVLIFPFAIS